MAKTSMSIGMDSEVKEKAQQIFCDLGMDMTTAINVFLHQVILHNGFPFELQVEVPDARILAACEEGERLINDMGMHNEA